MTIGIILAVIFLLVIANILLKKNKNPTFRKITSVIHKFLGVLFLGVAIAHLALVLPLIKQRPIAMYLIGFIMIACAIAALLSYLFRKKLKQHWITIHKIVALVISICLVIHIYLGVSSLNEYKQIIENMDIKSVDVNQIVDGNYIGECDAGYIYAKVKVTIKDGEITAVKLLEHRTERGKAAEVIPDKILQSHNVKVDAITGATNSSKVIMKAAENALEQNSKVD